MSFVRYFNTSFYLVRKYRVFNLTYNSGFIMGNPNKEPGTKISYYAAEICRRSSALSQVLPESLQNAVFMMLRALFREFFVRAAESGNVGLLLLTCL